MNQTNSPRRQTQIEDRSKRASTILATMSIVSAAVGCLGTAIPEQLLQSAALTSVYALLGAGIFAVITIVARIWCAEQQRSFDVKNEQVVTMGISEIGVENGFVECPYPAEGCGCESCTIGLTPHECEEAYYEYLLDL